MTHRTMRITDNGA